MLCFSSLPPSLSLLLPSASSPVPILPHPPLPRRREIIEIVRKISLTSILSLLAPGTPTQCTFSVLLAIIYVKLYNSCAPFVADNDNVTAEVGQYQIFVTFFAVLVIKQSSLGDADENPLLYSFVDICLVGINMLMIGLLFSLAWREHKENKRVSAVQAKREFDEKNKKGKVLREDHVSTQQEVTSILAALKRHPQVLAALGDRLKRAAPEAGAAARRHGVRLDVLQTDELQMRLYHDNSFHLPRRHALKGVSAEDLIRGRLARQPRRRGLLLMPPETLQGLRAVLRSESFLDARHAMENPSSSSGGSHASDSELSDSSADSVRNDGEDKPEEAFKLHAPAFQDSEGDSIHTYETPSSHSDYSQDGDTAGNSATANPPRPRKFFDDVLLADLVEPQAISFLAPSRTWAPRGQRRDSDDDDDEEEEEKEERRGAGRDDDHQEDGDEDGQSEGELDAADRRLDALEADAVLSEYVEVRPDVALRVPRPRADDSAAAALELYSRHGGFDEADMEARQRKIDAECGAMAAWIVDRTSLILPQTVMKVVYSLHDADVTTIEMLAEHISQAGPQGGADLRFLERHGADEADNEEVIFALAAAGLIDLDEEGEEERRQAEARARQAHVDAECGAMADWVVEHTADVSPESILKMVYTLHQANMPTIHSVAERLGADTGCLGRLGLDECDVDELMNALEAAGLVRLYDDDGMSLGSGGSRGSSASARAAREAMRSRERERERPASNSSVLSSGPIEIAVAAADSDEDW